MVKGTAVYIHPENRYCTARFDFPGGSYNESFLLGRSTAEEREAKECITNARKQI